MFSRFNKVLNDARKDVIVMKSGETFPQQQFGLMKRFLSGQFVSIITPM